MPFGRYFEQFEVDAVYKHWPGKTVTEYDDHLFCLLTMNHHPLHMDAHYASESTDFGRNVVVGNYIYSLLLGMSVPDISGMAIANLEVVSLRHVVPMERGGNVPQRHDLWRDQGARKDPVEFQARSWRRTCGDNRLQPGWNRCMHLPAQGARADPGVRGSAR